MIKETTTMSLKYIPFALLAFLFISPSTGEFEFEGPFLGHGVRGRHLCPKLPPWECKVDSVQETGITCDQLKAFGSGVAVDPQLYGGEYGVHMVPMAHRYYYSRMNQAFGSCCPTNLHEIANMQLAVPWTGNVGTSAGQAWDIGYENRAFRRNCTFPTEQWPFICTGVDGTRGVVGERLGNLYYIPLLTNDAADGQGVWTLFGQCWDAVTPTDSYGSNSPVSWNVFSLTQTTISKEDKVLITKKLAQIGFPITKQSLVEIAFP